MDGMEPKTKSMAQEYCLDCPRFYAWVSMQGEYYGLKNSITKYGDDVLCKMICYCNNDFCWVKGIKNSSGWCTVMMKESDLKKYLNEDLGAVMSFQFKVECEDMKGRCLRKYVEDLTAGMGCVREINDKDCKFYVERNLEEWSEDEQ